MTAATVVHQDEDHYYPCPTCGGNGCRICRGTGELLDTTGRNKRGGGVR